MKYFPNSILVKIKCGPIPTPGTAPCPRAGEWRGGQSARQLRPARPATRICNRLTSPDQRSTPHNKYFSVAQNIFDTNKHDSCIQKLFLLRKKIFAHIAKIFDVCRSLSRVAGWLQVATHKRNRYKKVGGPGCCWVLRAANTGQWPGYTRLYWGCSSPR